MFVSCSFVDSLLFVEEERRLFVGMLPKNMGDNELTLMFAPYGALEDCVILKDRDGQSKGEQRIKFRENAFAYRYTVIHYTGCVIAVFCNHNEIIMLL